jgi:DNA repair photolyase
MERLALIEPPMSLAAMGRALGSSARELLRRQRPLSLEISKRFRAWKSKRAQERWKARRERIAALAAKVAEEGLRATRRRLEEQMGESLVFILNGDLRYDVSEDAPSALG